MISPNKQNLILLKQKNRITRNGHKLLTEKRNGLIISFLKMSREGKKLEQLLQDHIQGYLKRYKGGMAFISVEELLNELTTTKALSLIVEKKRKSGVFINNLLVTVAPPKRSTLKPVLQDLLGSFGELFKELIELTQLKINSKKVAEEIHKTNRQLSNLDQKILSIEADIKFIKAALMEKENYEKSVLMKIFN